MDAHGLHVDDLQKLRILEPELGNDTERMKEECGTFIENITEFRKMADDLIDITDKVCLWKKLNKMKNDYTLTSKIRYMTKNW